MKVITTQKSAASTSGGSSAIKPRLFKGEIGEIWGKDKWRNLFGQVDISTLVLFRISFGLVMLWEVTRYFENGWINSYWIRPEFNFSYWPFDFSPLGGNGMYALFYLMGGLAVLITLGLFYRVAMALFWLCFTYMFLLEQTRYLNHFYLITLVSFLMIFLPLNRSGSLDARLFKNIRSETAAAWSLWLVRFMIGVTYFYGGIAKINSDWFKGEPLRTWLKADESIPIFGQYLDEDWMIYSLSYSGLLLDLLIVPALLFRKTRIYGFLAIMCFHLMNDQMFIIGIFPWFMMLATTIFFDPSWPRRLVNALREGKPRWPFKMPSKTALAVPQVLNRQQRTVLICLALWCSFQMLYPLRHLVIPGNVSWTEEGHRYAWHMKLRTKRGRGTYRVVDNNTGETTIVKAKDYLRSWQVKKMMSKPLLIWQFCQYLEEDFAKKGQDVAIYADIEAKLNGRPYQQLIDPEVDLTSVPRPWFPPTSWIVPLTTPLEVE